MDDIELLKSQVKALEEGNAKLLEQWELLRISILDAWRSIYLISTSEPLQSETDMENVAFDADANIGVLERPTKVETIV
jgi:hypothetical protein